MKNPALNNDPMQDARVILMLGISSPGYRSLALSYLREALLRDQRLPSLMVGSIETNTAQDPWWIAYRILNLAHKPDFIAIPCYCWNMSSVKSIIKILESELPEAKIILGGPEVSPIAAQTLEENPHAHAVISGEGEKALCNFIHSHMRGGDPSSVAGVTMRVEGEIVTGPPAQVIEKLDDIPLPYTESNPPATDGSAYIETFRGCPHSCAYCFEGKGIARIRSFSPERIKREIKTLAETPGMQSFSFIDSVFNLTLERLKMLTEILEPYAQKGLMLHTIEVDIEKIDDEQADLLARCGVRSVETGPQTTCECALELNKRRLDVDKYRAGVEACKRVGIAVDTDYIIGLPGDTPESVLESFRFAVSIDPNKIQASTLHVLPGTELSEQSEEFGLNYDKDAPHELISSATISYNELMELEVFGSALGKFHRAKR